MNEAERIWRSKADDEVVEASTCLDEFTQEGERVIRAELRRRALSEPPPPIGTCPGCGRSINPNHLLDECSQCSEPLSPQILRLLEELRTPGSSWREDAGVASDEYTDKETAGGASQDLKRIRIAVLVLLTVLSIGPYYLIWFLRQYLGLNQLDSAHKLRRWPFIAGILFVTAHVLFSMTGRPSVLSPTWKRALVDLAGILFGLGELALGALMIMQQFCVKRIIEDHLAHSSKTGALNTLDTSASLSSVLTFFLGIFYLQHVINTRIIDAKLERRCTA